MKSVRVVIAGVLLTIVAVTCNESDGDRSGTTAPVDPAKEFASRMIDEGRQTFRYETFGDEAFWGGTLQLHQAIATVSPSTALSVGLKVDSEAVPAAVAAGIKDGSVDLNDPKNTLALLKARAVVGVTGFFDDAGNLTSFGIQCALCHSTVDDSFAPGIGKRLDGWPNRDLDVGAIVSLAPNLQPVADLLGSAGTAVDVATLKAVLARWGPGRFDAEIFMDGKALKPDGTAPATVLPAAFGLSGVNLTTYTGWGSATYWNAFVANLEMHGQGTFFDPRLASATKFPIAQAAGSGNVRAAQDRVTPRLAALHFYQLSLEPPRPPAGSFDAAAAARGEQVFNGPAKCATCHVPPLFTEPGWNMHTAAEMGIDDFQALRSPDERYRTTPLRGLFTRAKGGFYHDGRFATLADVVEHYDGRGIGNGGTALGLSEAQKADLVEYLKSL